ncbi:MAG: hypothetical protein HWE26_08475, partial [Alteromonadaceae bacterium]|nr:hypothetical protein [Alteromonadaceae bacterium]
MRILVILLVIIVSFAAGHYSYPLLKHNQMQPSPLKHQADQVENSVAKSSETLNPNQHQEPSSVASQDKKKSINGSEHVESNKNAATDPASSQSSAGQEIATTGNVDNIGNHAVVSEEAIRELKQWQTQHKQALKELFNDRVPEHFAE